MNSQDPAFSEIESLRSEVAQLREQFERRSITSAELLPPPIDPQRLLPYDAVRAANSRGAFFLPGTDVYFRIDGYARGDVMYDTGFVGSGIQLFPSTIALDGSPDAQRRGQTQLTGGQSRLSFDGQADSDIGHLRGYVELDFLKDGTDPRLRHVYGEWAEEDLDLIGGQTWSTFMDPAALPGTIAETSAAGVIFRRQPQFRFTHSLNDAGNYSVAIEDPLSTDFTLPDPMTDVRLERWPDFVARIRIADKNIGSFQLASLVRGIGYEDTMSDEHLRTGWGVSATGKLLIGERDSLGMGVAGGRGIGAYLAGLGANFSAAGPDVGGFRTLDAIGAFATCKHHWSEEFHSNLFYGYSTVDSTPLMPATAAKNIHNAGVNLIWSPRPGFGVGIEYNYGLREVRDGANADNHRIQFGVQFGP
ncbi:MAG: porin [Planctomycetaceae bacterium]|nr:porin [Planctomycetaceae bacterium]